MQKGFTITDVYESKKFGASAPNIFITIKEQFAVRPFPDITSPSGQSLHICTNVLYFMNVNAPSPINTEMFTFKVSDSDFNSNLLTLIYTKLKQEWFPGLTTVDEFYPSE